MDRTPPPEGSGPARENCPNCEHPAIACPYHGTAAAPAARFAPPPWVTAAVARRLFPLVFGPAPEGYCYTGEYRPAKVSEPWRHDDGHVARYGTASKVPILTVADLNAQACPKCCGVFAVEAPGLRLDGIGQWNGGRVCHQCGFEIENPTAPLVQLGQGEYAHGYTPPLASGSSPDSPGVVSPS